MLVDLSGWLSLSLSISFEREFTGYKRVVCLQPPSHLACQQKYIQWTCCVCVCSVCVCGVCVCWCCCCWCYPVGIKYVACQCQMPWQADQVGQSDCQPAGAKGGVSVEGGGLGGGVVCIEQGFSHLACYLLDIGYLSGSCGSRCKKGSRCDWSYAAWACVTRSVRQGRAAG